MRVGVLGTGGVGQAIAGKLSELGHEVVVGTRDPDQTLGRQEPDVFGNPPFGAWLAEHPAVRLAGLADAAAHGEVVVNATAGGAALEALRLAGEANLDGKVLVDVANRSTSPRACRRRCRCPTPTASASASSASSPPPGWSRPSTP